MNEAIKKTLKVIRAIPLRLYWLPYFYSIKKRKDIILTESFIYHSSFYRFKKYNWGDDINKFFFEMITRRNIVSIPFTIMLYKPPIGTYSMIGSILGFYELTNKYVYGSGLQNPNSKIRGVPKKIYSVRGPKTREILMKNGISCPEKYGDPALLLPVFYKPSIKKTGKICIIPNMATNYNKNPIICNLLKTGKYKVIDMKNYGKWTDVIDEILGAEYVISESLHGLIVAETYSIPNVWVEFEHHPEYWSFKYLDYYESIGKKYMESIHIIDDVSMSHVRASVEDWVRGNIDYEKLLSFLPFEVINNNTHEVDIDA